MFRKSAGDLPNQREISILEISTIFLSAPFPVALVPAKLGAIGHFTQQFGYFDSIAMALSYK